MSLSNTDSALLWRTLLTRKEALKVCKIGKKKVLKGGAKHFLLTTAIIVNITVH